MQLPATDELVLVSGLPPIRARKLRYYEDSNFRRRVLQAPRLSSAAYADRPPLRSDDWSGRTAPRAVPMVGPASLDEGGGGLEHQRHPGLARPRRARRHSPDQLDLLGLGLDDADPAVDAGTHGPLSPLNPVVAADGINESSGRGGDLMPGL
jgi:type IV secretion system protein VirD4